MEKPNVKKDDPAVKMIPVFHQSANSLKRLNETKPSTIDSVVYLAKLLK